MTTIPPVPIATIFLDGNTMVSGRPRNLGKKGTLLGLALALACGCAGTRGRLGKSLLADRTPAAHARSMDTHYRVHSSDVLSVEVRGHPEYSGTPRVGLDGRIVLADHSVEVEGRPTSRIAAGVAKEVGVAGADVKVSVRDFNSQHLYLFGEIDAKHQVMPYRGPETILDLLQRVGGATGGAALGDVRVVRSHVADGQNPEVFHVDLNAILVKKELQTNIRLEPSDHIHIGQSRRSAFTCQLPPWLQNLCRGKKKPAPKGKEPVK